VPAGCKPISGSFATSLIATFWDRREALHQSRLVESLSGGGAVGAE
jgi:DHA2 family multidrug resistance protein